MQAHATCPIYTWDREHACLRLTGVATASPGLPADLASFRLEGRQEIPILLLASVSLSPGTRVRARLLGALGSLLEGRGSQALPTDSWMFVAAAENDPTFADVSSIEMLQPSRLHVLQAYTEKQAREAR